MTSANTAANRLWRCLFRYRGQSLSPAVAEFWTLLARMRLWTPGKKFMWYGRSGYYQASLSCAQSRKVVAARLRSFYSARRGVFSESSADDRMLFSRGRRPWSWFMPSETRQPQVVDITLSEQEQMTNVAIDYHVTNRLGLLTAPCMFDREIAKLREELEKP